MQDKGKQKEVINIDDESQIINQLVNPHGEGTSKQAPTQLEIIQESPIDNKRQDPTIVSVEDINNQEELNGINNVVLSRKEAQHNPNPILGFVNDNFSMNTPLSYVSSCECVKETPVEENVANFDGKDGVQGDVSNTVKKDLNFLHKNWHEMTEEENEDYGSSNQNQNVNNEEVIKDSVPPNQNLNVNSEKVFETVMSKSKKKKAILKVEYNTRSRADSRSLSL